jgi:iron complex transport system ATP-binding protein
MIKANNLSVTLGSKDILKNVSVDILPGKLTAVIGSNGSGKSTLLKTLSGSNKKYSGKISYHGDSIENLKADSLANSRSVVSQSYPDDIPFTGRQIVMMPLKPSDNPDKTKIEDICRKLKVDKYIDNNYHTLSGGEKQRIQIARALVQHYIASNNEFTLFLDEPGSGLDISASVLLGSMVRELTEKGLAIFWVIHDINMALELADRVIVMKGGTARTYENIADLTDGSVLSEVFGIVFERFSSSHIQNKPGNSSGSERMTKLHPKFL